MFGGTVHPVPGACHAAAERQVYDEAHIAKVTGGAIRAFACGWDTKKTMRCSSARSSATSALCIPAERTRRERHFPLTYGKISVRQAPHMRVRRHSPPLLCLRRGSQRLPEVARHPPVRTENPRPNVPVGRIPLQRVLGACRTEAMSSGVATARTTCTRDLTTPPPFAFSGPPRLRPSVFLSVATQLSLGPEAKRAAIR